MGFLFNNDSPLHFHGYLIWPLGLALSYLILYLQEKAKRPQLGKYHFAAFILVSIILGLSMRYLGSRLETHISDLAFALPAFSLLVLLLVLSTEKLYLFWPFKSQPSQYLLNSASWLLALLSLWSFFSNFRSSGSADLLNYFPLFNAIDLCQLACLLLAFNWLRVAKTKELITSAQGNSVLTRTVAILGFFWGQCFNCQICTSFCWGQVSIWSAF